MPTNPTRGSDTPAPTVLVALADRTPGGMAAAAALAADRPALADRLSPWPEDQEFALLVLPVRGAGGGMREAALLFARRDQIAEAVSLAFSAIPAAERVEARSEVRGDHRQAAEALLAGSHALPRAEDGPTVGVALFCDALRDADGRAGYIATAFRPEHLASCADALLDRHGGAEEADVRTPAGHRAACAALLWMLGLAPDPDGQERPAPGRARDHAAALLAGTLALHDRCRGEAVRRAVSDSLREGARPWVNVGVAPVPGEDGHALLISVTEGNPADVVREMRGGGGQPVRRDEGVAEHRGRGSATLH